MSEENPILRVRDLVVEYAVREGVIRANDHVSLDVAKGLVNALVGESGSGKTTLVDAVMGTLPPNGYIRKGEIYFKDKNILKLNPEERRKIRWEKIAMVFQAAQNSLNPVMRVAEHFIDTVLAHKSMSKDEILRKAEELLKLVRLDPEQVLNAFPHELSGGMKQRVIIALSLMLDPELLILDEPTSALDVMTQHYLIRTLKEVHEKKGITMLLVTHDLPVVAEIADRVAIMYCAKIVEVGDVRKIFYEPLHPYTHGLIHSIPSIIGDLSKMRPIPGEPPSLLNPPPGCRFHPRCPYATEKCKKMEPPLVEVEKGRLVACFRYA
ncbi:MAG: ABC transporter ATP-binding protein [Thermoprotei archaeon]|nr:MAG: ABC transporter ATP-binding protein [Thermoprotei archaeon]